jgi:hypothetical protein
LLSDSQLAGLYVARDCHVELCRARQKGQAASAHIRDGWTWERSAQAVIRRIEALQGLPVRRQTNR